MIDRFLFPKQEVAVVRPGELVKRGCCVRIISQNNAVRVQERQNRLVFLKLIRGAVVAVIDEHSDFILHPEERLDRVTIQNLTSLFIGAAEKVSRVGG